MKTKLFSSLLAVAAAACLLPAGASAVAGPTVTSAPTLTNAAAPTIEFNLPGATIFSCAVDGAPATTCTSPLSLPNLADGTHTVQLTAMVMMLGPPICVPDGMGGQMCFPGPPIPTTTEATSVSFTIDRTAPVTSLTAGPGEKSASRKSANATFVFSAEAGATLVCTLDGAVVAACASPLKLKNLKVGIHKLVITATDAAGNAGAPLTRIFAVNSKTTTFKFNAAGTKAKRCKTKKSKGGKKKKSCKNVTVK